MCSLNSLHRKLLKLWGLVPLTEEQKSQYRGFFWVFCSSGWCHGPAGVCSGEHFHHKQAWLRAVSSPATILQLNRECLLFTEPIVFHAWTMLESPKKNFSHSHSHFGFWFCTLLSSCLSWAESRSLVHVSDVGLRQGECEGEHVFLLHT